MDGSGEGPLPTTLLELESQTLTVSVCVSALCGGSSPAFGNGPGVPGVRGLLLRNHCVPREGATEDKRRQVLGMFLLSSGSIVSDSACGQAQGFGSLVTLWPLLL